MDRNKLKFAIFYIFICASLYLITLMADFKKNSKDLQPIYKENLPPAENVLLAAGYRSGSSFLAELFNQNDEVFYVKIT